MSKNIFFHCFKFDYAVRDDGEEAKVHKRSRLNQLIQKVVRFVNLGSCFYELWAQNIRSIAFSPIGQEGSKVCVTS